LEEVSRRTVDFGVSAIGGGGVGDGKKLEGDGLRAAKVESVPLSDRDNLPFGF
jgi:hypothetical protein